VALGNGAVIDTVAVSLPKSEFTDFIKRDLGSLVYLMYQKTAKVFLPTAVSISVSRP